MAESQRHADKHKAAMIEHVRLEHDALRNRIHDHPDVTDIISADPSDRSFYVRFKDKSALHYNRDTGVWSDAADIHWPDDQQK